MKKQIVVFILFTLAFTLSFSSLAQNKTEFYQTKWGSWISFTEFCDKAKQAGYDGIETSVPGSEKEIDDLKASLKKNDLKLILQVHVNKWTTADSSLMHYQNILLKAINLKPVAINSHTGSDFYTAEENKEYFKLADKLSKQYNIPIYHETHRGRFSYSLMSTLPYIKSNPELLFTLDVSHWMVVHESLLDGQNDLLKPIIKNTRLIHARVGHPEGPQVNDPEAPEWERAVKRHLDIWEEFVNNEWANGRTARIVTEFGPAGYLPTLPFTQQPVGDQWKANVYIMQAIKDRLRK